MKIESTPIFDKDIKKLDKNERKLLKGLIYKIQKQPENGKPMEHHANVFSKRARNRRLVWKINKKVWIILLIMYKNRDEVYDELRKLKI